MLDCSQKTGKREFLLVGAVLLTAALLFLWNRFYFSAPAAVVEISIDGTVAETLDLSKNQELDIEGVNGGHNHLVILNGEAWVSEASCPDKICVHQGKISRDGEMIVCLPNRMIAKISGQ